MKKTIAILALCLMMIGMVAMPVSAATPKETILNAAETNLPSAVMKEYRPLFENILSQITVTEEQAEQVVDCIEESRAFFKSYKGLSLSEYTVEEREFALDMVVRICEILGLTAKYTPSASPKHDGDMVCEIYNAAGQKLADIDPDAVKKTNVPESNVNYTYVVLAAVLTIGTAAAVVLGKKFVTER